MKKLLLLGGSRYLLPIIEICKKLCIKSITCDYLPNNIAHKYSDEYHNVSIIDKEAVLELAQELKIDGIMSFACDPGVVTASYVAEKMGLPFQGSYESVRILQNKDLFRKFLEENGFNVPNANGYTKADDALSDVNFYKWPIIVKPVDSAGSKGVTKVEKIEELQKAISKAIRFSKSKTFIIEEFIQQKGFSSDTDCYSVNGKLVYCSFSNQYFDKKASNPYTPAAYSWPSYMPSDIQGELRNELQRLFSLLQLKTSIYNIETRQGIDGKPYIMEVSPRGGGNRLAEVLKYASGEDLITNAVKAAIGNDNIEIDKDPIYNGYWAEVILHSEIDGKYKDLWLDNKILPNVVEKDIWVTKGTNIHSFSGANEAIGTLILRFDKDSEMREFLDNNNKFTRVITE